MYKTEYPKPQFRRETWLNLNGKWAFDFDDQNVGIKEKWFLNHSYTKQIEVPFAFQTALSGIHDLTLHDYVWYQRTFKVPNTWNDRVRIHFGAVDYESWVYINGQLIGHHIGGNDSFSYDITDYLNHQEEIISVRVFDPSYEERIPRGKQTWTEKSHAIWYTRTTGIWQTVWLEPHSTHALKQVKITSDIEQGSVTFKAVSYTNVDKKLRIRIYDEKQLITDDCYLMTDESSRSIQVWHTKIFETNLHHAGKTWTPEHPFLYDVVIDVLVDEKVVDSIQTYFGMRKIHTENGMVYLNNRPYYLKLVLDQGYYKPGLLTAPSDADLEKDIILSKQLGFNGCRKHQKIEEERFLYHADKLGFLVWEELPSTAVFDVEYHKAIIDEWVNVIHRDYNHPSIIAWVPLNESWGVPNIQRDKSQQNYALTLYHLTKSIDPTRLVIANDGWEQTTGDICAIHNYAHGAMADTAGHKRFSDALSTKEDILNHYPAHRNVYADGFKHEGQPIVLTEFGGISFAVEEKEGWGYSNVNNGKDFLKEYQRILQAIDESTVLAGFCYTQLTDVEQEINGLLTYSREAKVPLEEIKLIHDRVSFHLAKKRD